MIVEARARIVRMELKYCERCGGLLLRRTGEAVVYCGPCEAMMRDLPAVRCGNQVGGQTEGKVQGCERTAVAGPASFPEEIIEQGAAPARIGPRRVTLEESRRRFV